MRALLAVCLWLPSICLLGRVANAAPAAGAVVGWGENVLGQATGVTSGSYFSTGLVAVAGHPVTDAIAVAAGFSHGIALRANHTVVGWGSDSEAQATAGSPANSANGPVVINGAVLSNVVAISAAGSHSLALKDNGTVVAWGATGPGHARPPTGLDNVVAIAAGWAHNFAVRGDGTVAAWGAEGTDWASSLRALSNVVAVTAATAPRGATLFLRADGTVTALEPGGKEERVPGGLSNVVEIAAGASHFLALKQDGTIQGWGADNAGQASGGTGLSNVVAVAASGNHSLALRADGTVAAWGSCMRRPISVPAGLRGGIAIATGESFCLAITTNSLPFAPERMDGGGPTNGTVPK